MEAAGRDPAHPGATDTVTVEASSVRQVVASRPHHPLINHHHLQSFITFITFITFISFITFITFITFIIFITFITFLPCMSL